MQTAVEAVYDLTNNNITARQHGREDGGQVVPVHRHALLLHLVLEPDRLPPAADEPRDDHDLRRSRCPSLAIYAATANLSVPLVLTLFVWLAYHVEGIRAQGVRGYLAELDPVRA